MKRYCALHLHLDGYGQAVSKFPYLLEASNSNIVWLGKAAHPLSTVYIHTNRALH